MTYIQTEEIVQRYELVLILLFVSAIYVLPRGVWRRGDRCCRRAAKKLSLEGHPLTGAVLVTGIATIFLDLVFALSIGLPEANFHDEFANLLSGTTFAAGRLTNPTPPFAEHFESFHILTSPSYQSKYPPGQGLFLAAGLWMGGFAGLGVWLSHAAAAAGICWCLGQFVSARWAALGALTFGLHDRVTLWWGQSYWGGAVAALGGALLFGGFGSWLRDGRSLGGGVMGIGAGILAISRPAEGLLCCLCVLAGLAARYVTEPSAQRGQRLRSAVCGGTIGVAPFLVFLAVYNIRVTGDPLRLPYRAWMEQYHIDLSGPARDAVRDERMTPFAKLQYQFFAEQEYRYRISFACWKLLFRLRPFYLPGLAMLALIGFKCPRSLGGRVLSAAVLIVLLFILGNPAGGFPHYLAPVAAPVVLGMVNGLRRAARRVVKDKPGIARAAMGACVLVGCARLAFAWPYSEALAGISVESARAAVAMEFETRRRDALVLVLRADGRLTDTEYVYNGPDVGRPSAMGGPRVIWARSLGEPRDRAFVASFPDRLACIYYLDAGGGTLVEFEDFARNNPGYSLVTNRR